MTCASHLYLIWSPLKLKNLGARHAQEEKHLRILFWLEIVRKRQLGKAGSRWQYNSKKVVGDIGFKVRKLDEVDENTADSRIFVAVMIIIFA